MLESQVATFRLVTLIEAESESVPGKVTVMGAWSELLTRRRFLWLAALSTGALALEGCADESSSERPVPGASTTFDEPSSAAPASEPAAASSVPAEVTERIGALTLEHKVAQLFVVAPEALVENVSQVTQAGEATHGGVSAWPVGGIIYFSDNLQGPEQTKAMLEGVKSFFAEDGNVPPFVAVDEEGGTVARIANNEAFGVLNVGDAAAFGVAGDTEAAERAAERIADYLEPLGFNLDFAPVCDVVDPLRSDTMGQRSFSSGAQMAAAMVKAQVKGFLSRKMLCCAKHFPGIGSAAGDSHDGSITVDKTLEQLEEVDLTPFKAAIEAGVPLIMVGHLNLPAVVGDDTPAPLSAKVVQELLRDELGFTGIIITDSLSMGAITERYTAAEAAVAALQAGCDMPLMPDNFQEAYQGVLDAVTSGALTEARIDESLERILAAKLKYLGSC